VLRTGRGVRQEVWVALDDRRGCYELVVEPQRDAKGRISGVVCATSDITERALAQEELEQTRQQLQRLAARLQDTIEEERRRIAQDMHDQVGAVLTGIRMGLANLAPRLPVEDCRTRDALQQIAGLAERAMSSTREICARIQPPALEDVGLAETCRWYLRDWSRSTGLRATGRFRRLEPEPAHEVSIDLFRTLQELLTNAARHSGASRVRASLSVDRGAIRLRVSDDGHGFDPESARRGLGFTGLRERAARHGGCLDIRSGPRGSTVTVTLPRPASK
jgi:signal transduction histidine kinase